MKQFNFKSLLSVSLFTLFMFSGMNAFAKDVHDSRSRAWLKVETEYLQPKSLENTRVTFTRCDDELCKISRPIGRSKYYTLEELLRQYQLEYQKMGGSICADLALVIGGVYAVSGYAIYGSTMAVTASPALVNALTFGAPPALTLGLATAVDALNPKHFYDQAEAIRNEIIFDHDVTVKNIEDYIHVLESVLDNLDS